MLHMDRSAMERRKAATYLAAEPPTIYKIKSSKRIAPD